MLLPILGRAFFALQLDCGNISTVLTSTITSDLTITTNQINLLAWGFVATFQALVPNYASFLATRLLLSLLEGGYILGALFYLSTWYKKKELSSRVTLFFFGQKLVASPPLSPLFTAYWPLTVEGLITIFIGIFFLLLLPTSTTDARPLLTHRSCRSYFTPDELEVIQQRMVLTLAFAYLSDRTNKRGLFVHLGSTWNLIGYICLREMPTTASGQHKDGTLVAASVGYAAMHILNVARLAVNCTTPQERSVALALVIMAANLSGISGGQIFRTGDAPLYRHGLTALSTLAGAAWVQAVGCWMFGAGSG
ncbi:uncharacterized protein BO95DRAFT_466863 [Aspergillus brunneoviolaceus CBS 621.78]|uniref:Uncharacterized protein n=1 Tax=Aspergillus brunneoviolaceus CBS 621.78 TaxID=1450534 RepID=A0ACD1FZL0_9EURO|nr:hypothetical protein BO95DRAFT_466863 [Aspergillus brunneoviolaceus CBS 621.78]RAH42392.1 hypothetical protein BO95DRAFT_466863 [Aspergillus brunneoviolaceus CBS 621.78]